MVPPFFWKQGNPMGQQLFDYEESATARDKAIDAVETARPNWAAKFELAIVAVAKQGKWFTTDDVLRQYPELESCPEKRVIGAAVRRLSAAGVIEPGGYIGSERKSSHARPKRTWKLKQ